MRKIGYTRIKKNRNGVKPTRCVNCGDKASFKVTFKDIWEKMTLALCKNCATKEYEELSLQTRINWLSREEK